MNIEIDYESLRAIKWTSSNEHYNALRLKHPHLIPKL